MAVSSVVCRSRFLLRFEIQRLFYCSSLGNACLINNCMHVCNIRQCRKLSVTVPIWDKTKETEENDSKKDSDLSSTSSDSESDDEDVIVEYIRGLPQFTVPLPSRNEKCRFNLRPISNTVGDFLDMLKAEDKGIDRAVIHSTEGTRIASSNTIESLLQEDFRLLINDNSYYVKIPEQGKVLNEELKKFDDIKTIVSKLYETLNLEDFHVQKEKDVQLQLETLRQEILPFEEQQLQLETAAERKSNFLAWAGLGLMSIQFGILARLTWWEYSWDIMEPVTYFVTYGTAMAAYSYFVLTKEEYILQDVKKRQHLLSVHKRSKKLGLDLLRYNQLKDQIHSLEVDLLKMKTPLRQQMQKEALKKSKQTTDKPKATKTTE